MSHRYAWVPVVLALLLAAAVIGCVVAIFNGWTMYAIACGGALLHIGLWFIAMEVLFDIEKQTRR